MGYVKRVGDVSALFAAGAASMYLLRQFMQYDFIEKAEGMTEKLKFFFSDEMRKNYNFYLLLIALLLISFAISTIFHKLPQIPLAVSAVPIMQVIMMADLDRIYERPMVYLILAIIHFVGCLYECIRRDKEDSGRRSAIGADLLALVIFGFCAVTLHAAKDPTAISKEHISAFELTVHNAFSYSTPTVWAFNCGAIIFPVLVAIRLIHGDLYYIDGILSTVPLVASFVYWGSEEKTVFAPIAVCLFTLYSAARITIMLCCKAKINQPKNSPEKADVER